MRQDNAYFEAALVAFGDSKGAEVTMLQESLRSTRRAAQVPPLGVQLAQCEQFVSCTQKRLAALDEERAKLVSELEEGEARLQRLRVETAQRHQDANPAAPAPPPDWAAELQLRSLVTQLQEERIQLGPRHLEEELQDLRWEVDALRHERDSLVAEREAVGSDTTVGVTGPSSDRMAHLIEEGNMKRHKMEAALTKTARHGLRGVRVGEASHPGPPKELRRSGECLPRLGIVLVTQTPP